MENNNEGRYKPGTTPSYVAVPYAVMKALAVYRPGGGEAKLIWAILLLTRDNFKMQGYISIRQLMDLTGLSRRMVIDNLRNLEAKQMVRITRNPPRVSLIRFERNTEKWIVRKKSFSRLRQIQRKKKKYQEKVAQEIEQELKRKNETEPRQ